MAASMIARPPMPRTRGIGRIGRPEDLGVPVLEQRGAASQHVVVLVDRRGVLNPGQILDQDFVPVQVGNLVEEGEVVFDLAPEANETCQAFGLRQLHGQTPISCAGVESHAALSGLALERFSAVPRFVGRQNEIKMHRLPVQPPLRDRRARMPAQLVDRADEFAIVLPAPSQDRPILAHAVHPRQPAGAGIHEELADVEPVLCNGEPDGLPHFQVGADILVNRALDGSHDSRAHRLD
jgi:hypothetical protein